MKKLIIILVFIPFLAFTQESKFYLTKRDTLYIYFNENLKLNNTSKYYSNIVDNKKIVGLETKYLLFSDSIKIHKDILFEKEKKEEKKGIVVSRPYRSSEFGILFKRIDHYVDCASILNNEISYHSYRKDFETVNTKKYDSIRFDKEVVFKRLKIQNESGFYSSKILEEKKLKKLNVFIFDASHKNYLDLVKLVANNPFVLFIYREKINFRYSTITNGLLFEEVIYEFPEHRL